MKYMRKHLFDCHFRDRCRWRDYYIKRNCRKVGNEGLHSIRVTASLSLWVCLNVWWECCSNSYWSAILYAQYKFVLPKHSSKHFAVSIQIACCNTLIRKQSRITGFYLSGFLCGLTAGYFVEVREWKLQTQSFFH